MGRITSALIAEPHHSFGPSHCLYPRFVLLMDSQLAMDWQRRRGTRYRTYDHSANPPTPQISPHQHNAGLKNMRPLPLLPQRTFLVDALCLFSLQSETQCKWESLLKTMGQTLSYGHSALGHGVSISVSTYLCRCDARSLVSRHTKNSARPILTTPPLRL